MFTFYLCWRASELAGWASAGHGGAKATYRISGCEIFQVRGELTVRLLCSSLVVKMTLGLWAALSQSFELRKVLLINH